MGGTKVNHTEIWGKKPIVNMSLCHWNYVYLWLNLVDYPSKFSSSKI